MALVSRALQDSGVWLDAGIVLTILGFALYVVKIKVHLFEPALAAFLLALTFVGAVFEAVGGAIFITQRLRGRRK